jgi:predicted permease
MMQDLKHALRRLLRAPLASGVVLLTLALGIGANTVLYSAVSAILLRPFPFRAQDRLVMVWERDDKTGQGLLEVSYPGFLDWRGQTRHFEGLAAIPNVVSQGFTFRGPEGPVRFAGSSVSANFFDVLGARPLLGRGFSAEEDQLGGPPAVVLSHGLWQRSFGGDPGIVGRAVVLGARSYTVVGVMDAAFRFPAGAELWTPIATHEPQAAGMRGVRWLNVVGRLAPGATLEQAKAELDTVVRREAVTYEGSAEGRSAVVTPLADHILGQTRPALLVLLAAVVLLLLVACLNVAGLLLAQAVGRGPELALRVALGAGRWAIARAQLAESLWLAAGGAGLGLLLAPAGIAFLRRLAPADVPRLDDVTLDGRVLAFTLLVSLLTAAACGLLPAWRAARAEAGESLKESQRSATSRDALRIRGLLLGLEVGLSAVLLVVAGLLARSLLRLHQVELGFDPRDVLAVGVDLKDQDLLLERVRALPGVESAAGAMLRPLEYAARGEDAWVLLEGQAEEAIQTNPALAYDPVTPGYFRTLRIPFRAGRDFEARDTAAAPGVVIVGESAARRLWPGQDAVGQRLITIGAKRDAAGHPLWSTVIGVVADVRQRGLEIASLDLYVPAAQAEGVHGLLVRSGLEPMALLAAIRREVAALDDGAPLTRVALLTRVVAEARAGARFRSLVLGLFAALSLLLAALGVYASGAYSVARRTREIGVRLALGALPGDVLRLVVGQGSVPILWGAACGLAAGLLAGRALAGLLFGIRPADAVTVLGAAALLATAACVSLALPARRAARIDPAVALRDE